MADERVYTTEAKEHGRWTAIVALAAAGGNIGKAMSIAPAIAAALRNEKGVQGIGAAVYDSKVFAFTPTRIEPEPPKPGREASTRMLVYGVSPTSEDGEEEVFRTHRTDSHRGKEQEKLVRSLMGKPCLVYIYIDEFGTGKAAKKARVLEHIELKFGGEPVQRREAIPVDDGPEPERPAPKPAKQFSVGDWLAMFTLLSPERQERLTEWYPFDINDPRPEDLRSDSRLLAGFNATFENQEAEHAEREGQHR